MLAAARRRSRPPAGAVVIHDGATIRGHDALNSTGSHQRPAADISPRLRRVVASSPRRQAREAQPWHDRSVAVNVLPRDHEYHLPLTTSVTSSRFAPSAVRPGELHWIAGGDRLRDADLGARTRSRLGPAPAGGCRRRGRAQLQAQGRRRSARRLGERRVHAPACPGAEHGLAGGHRGRDLRGRPVRARRASDTASQRRHPAGGKPFLSEIGSALGNLAAVAGLLLLPGRYAPNWIVAVAAGARLLTVCANIAAGPRTRQATPRRASSRTSVSIGRNGSQRPARACRPPSRIASAPIASGLPPRGPVRHSREPHGLRQVGPRHLLAPGCGRRRHRRRARAHLFRDRPVPALPPAHHACDRKGRMGACPECT